MSDAKRPAPESSTPDLAALDQGWEDDDDEDLDDDDLDDGLDADALDAGWDSPKAKKTAAERAARRKEHAKRKADRRKQKVSATAQKQKQKKRKARASDAPPESGVDRDDGTHEDTHEDVAREGSNGVSRAADERPSEPRRSVTRARATAKPRSLRDDWTKMGLIVGAIVAVAAIAFYLWSKR